MIEENPLIVRKWWVVCRKEMTAVGQKLTVYYETRPRDWFAVRVALMGNANGSTSLRSDA